MFYAAECLLLQGAFFHFRSGKVQAVQHCTVQIVQLVTTYDGKQIKQHVHVYVLKQLACQIHSHDVMHCCIVIRCFACRHI